MSIADAQRGTNQPKDEVPEDGWSTSEGEGEEFVGSHTTVDPNLLSRLAALDKEKADKKSAGGPAPLERRDKTVTLDIGDLEFGEDPEASGVEEPKAAKPTESAKPSEPAKPAEEAVKAPFAPAPSAILPMTPPPPAAPAPPSLNPAVALMGNAKPKKPRPEMVHQTQAAGGMSGVMSGSMSGTASAAPTRAPEPVAAPAASIEVDREFASEKTQIFVPAMDDEPTKAKLKVVQGGGQQKEYLLARDRITIGRGTNNDILVPDIAMSRQHCEIKRMPDGRYRVGDLQSGNGTKLNGLRVLDSDLFGGDRIEVGNTILEFVLTGPGASRPPSDRKINYHPSETPPAKPAPSPGRMSAPAIAPVAPNYSGGGQSTMTHLQVAPPASSSNALVTVLIVGLGLIFVALALVIGATIYLDSQNKPQPPVAAGTQKDDKRAQDYYFEGIEFVKQQDWDKAEERFTVAADLGKDEHDFQSKKNAELQLERVRKEKTNQKALARGKELLEQGGFEDAIARFDTIRSGSVYYDEARSQGEQARQRYAKQLTEQAQVDFDAKKYDEADRKVLLALSHAPEFAAAKELQGKISELPSTTYVRPEKLAVVPREVKPGDVVPKEVKTPNPKDGKTPDPKDGKTPDGLASNDPKDKKGTEPGPSDKPDDKKAAGGGGVANFTQGLLLYRSRKYGEAQSFFDKIASDDAGTSGQKAKTLSSQIGEFQQAYNAGNQAFQGNDYVGAARFLTNAYRLDKAISGTGYHGEELRKKLSESNYQQAQAAFNGNNYQRAGSLLKQALTYEGGHAKSLQLLEQIEGKAKSLYIDAVNKKKSDPAQAKRIAQTIVVMLPESAETHQKAKQLLQELGP